MKMTTHDQYQKHVSFGDCDPAGIVYYPNILAWVDGAFHHHLRRFGGHQALCERLGSVGMGAVDVTCRFSKPLKDGDVLTIEMIAIDWGEKTFVLHYEGRTGQGVHFTSEETRGVFQSRGNGLSLSSTAPLKHILTGGDHG